MTMKTCKHCGKELPLSEFYGTKNSNDGHSSICKACHRTRVQEARQEKKRLKALVEQGGKQLKDYTPRELMQELARRGYRGKLEYVEKHMIDLDTIND